MALQPDAIKLDMDLIRNIDASRTRQAIVNCVTRLAHSLDIAVIAEGVETRWEMSTLCKRGIRLVQGYLLAKLALQRLPDIDWPALGTRRSKVG